MKTTFSTSFLIFFISVIINIPANADESDERDGSAHAIIKGTRTIIKEDPKVFSPNPTGALLRSVVIPGWGQFYNRKYIKGGVVAVGEGLLIYYLGKNWSKLLDYEREFERAEPNSTEQVYAFNNWQKYTDERNKYMWFTVAAVFLSMFDAYVDAHLIAFDREMNEDLKTVGIKISYRF